MADQRHVIDIILKARDEMGAAFASATAKVGLLEKEIEGSSKATDEFARRMRKLGDDAAISTQKLTAEIKKLGGATKDSLHEQVALEKAARDYVRTQSDQKRSAAEVAVALSTLIDRQKDFATALKESGHEDAKNHAASIAQANIRIAKAEEEGQAHRELMAERQRVALHLEQVQAEINERIARRAHEDRERDLAEVLANEAKIADARRESAVYAQDLARLEADLRKSAHEANMEAMQMETDQILRQEQIRNDAARNRAAQYDKERRQIIEHTRALEENQKRGALESKAYAEDERRRQKQIDSSNRYLDILRKIRDADTRAQFGRATGDEVLVVSAELDAARLRMQAQEVRAGLQTLLGEIETQIKLDGAAATAEAVAFHAGLKTLLTTVKQKIEVEVDEDQFNEMMSRRERTRDSGRGGGIFDGLDLEGSANRIAAFDNLIRGLVTFLFAGFLQPLIIMAGAAGAALVALGSSAVFAGGAIGGALTAGIAQALPALGLLATFASRFKAVLDATNQSQLLDQQNSYKGAQSNKRLADTSDAVANAQDGLKSALEGVADAHERVADAQGHLTDAREEARRQLEDLILAEQRAELAARGAVLSQRDAQRQLQEAIATGGDVAGAQLALDEANLGVQDSVGRALPRARDAAADARRDGIEGSDQVIAAKEQIKDARDAVEKAEQAVEKARRGVDRARRGADIAGANISAAAGKLNYLLANMSEAERAMFRAMQKLQDAFRGFAKEVTEPLTVAFTGMMGKLTTLFNDDKFRSVFKGLSSAMGDSMTSIFDEFTSGESMSQVFRIIEDLKDNLVPLTEILKNVGHLFLNIAEAAQPVLNALLESFSETTERWAEFTATAEGKNALKEWFEDALDSLMAFLKFGGAFVNLIMAIAGVGRDTGDDLLGGMTKGMNDLARDLREGGDSADFFKRMLKDTKEIIKAIGPIFTSIGHELGLIFGTQGEGVKSIQGFASLIADVVVPALGRFIRGVGHAVTELGTLAKLHPEVTKLAAGMLGFFLTFGFAQKAMVFLGPLPKILEAVAKKLLGVNEEVKGFKLLGVLLRNPFVWAVAAVVFLITKLGLLDDVFRELARAAKAFIDPVIEAFRHLGRAVDGAFGDGSVLGPILEHLVRMFGTLATIIAGAFGHSLALIINGVADLFEFFSNPVNIVTGLAKITAGVIGLTLALKGLGMIGLGGIVTKIAAALSRIPIIGGAFSGAAGAAGAGAGAAGASGAMGKFVTGLKAAAKPALFLGVGISAVEGIMSGFKHGSVEAGVRDFASSLTFGLVKSTADKAAEAGEKFVKTFDEKLRGYKIPRAFATPKERPDPNTDTSLDLSTTEVDTGPVRYLGGGKGGGSSYGGIVEQKSGTLKQVEDIDKDVSGFKSAIEQVDLFMRRLDDLNAEGATFTGARDLQREFGSFIKQLQKDNPEVVERFKEIGLNIKAITDTAIRQKERLRKEMAPGNLAFGFGKALLSDKKNVDKHLEGVIDDMKGMKPRARKEARDTILEMVKGLAEREELPKKTADKIADSVQSAYKDMRDKSRAHSKKIAKDTEQSLREAQVLMGLGLKGFVGLANKTLSDLGVKTIPAPRSAPPGMGGFGATAATGGWIGNQGERGKDLVPTWLGRGEYVLNWGKQAYLRARGVSMDELDKVDGYHAGGHGDAPGFARGGSIVPIPGQGGNGTPPGIEYINSSIKAAVMRLVRQFKLTITDAFDPTGSKHVSPGHLVTGTAVDFVPGPGGSWALLEQMGRQLEKRYDVIYGTAGIGRPLANHGRGNHMHVEFGGSAPTGGFTAGMVEHLKKKNFKWPAGGAIEDMGQAMFEKVRKSINKFMDKNASYASEGPSGAHGEAAPPGQLREWLTQGLKRTGHFTQANLNALYGRMMQESGGNPRAINLWDSNAAKGIPSKGLLQTIDPTFQSYRDKKLPNDVYHPLANIVAAINYMFARYGHIVGPSGTGYAKGGAVPGSGSGDTVPAMLTPGEHVFTKGEVEAAGGHGVLYQLRRMLGGGKQGGPRGYAEGGAVLHIGDSLGVNIAKEIGKYLDKVKTVAVGGKNSEWGLAQLEKNLKKTFSAVIWDMGTNDGSAEAFAKALRKAYKKVGNDREFIVPTLAGTKGNIDAAEKNRIIREFAKNRDNVNVVDWRHQARKGDVKMDEYGHVYGGAAKTRAAALASGVGSAGEVSSGLGGPEKQLAELRKGIFNLSASYGIVIGRDIKSFIGEMRRLFAANKNIEDKYEGKGLSQLVKNFDYLTRDDGILAQMDAALERATNSRAARIGLASVGLRRGLNGRLEQNFGRRPANTLEAQTGGVQAPDGTPGTEAMPRQFLSEEAVMRREVVALDKDFSGLKKIRAATIRGIKGVREALQAIRKGGIDESERKEYQQLATTRNALFDRLDASDQAIISNRQSRLAKAQERFSAATERMLRGPSRAMDRIAAGIANAGRRGDVDAVAQLGQANVVAAEKQAEILKDRAEALVAKAKTDPRWRKMADDAVKASEDAQENVAKAHFEAVTNAINVIDARAGFAGSRADLATRVGGVLARTGQAVQGARWNIGAAGMRTAAATAARDQSLSLIGGRAEYDRLSQLPFEALTEAQRALVTKIGDLDVTVAESTQTEKELQTALHALEVELINQRVSRATGAINSSTGIWQRIAQATGASTTAQQESNLTRIGSVLREAARSLTDKIGTAISSGQFGAGATSTLDQLRTAFTQGPEAYAAKLAELGPTIANLVETLGPEMGGQFESLIGSMTDNTMAVLDNTIATNDLTGKKEQDFTSASWAGFRRAVFDGMGGLLPEYDVPQLYTGGLITKKGIFELHPGEHVVNPSREKLGVGSQTLNLNVTKPIEVADEQALIKTVGWEMKTANTMR